MRLSIASASRWQQRWQHRWHPADGVLASCRRLARVSLARCRRLAARVAGLARFSAIQRDKGRFRAIQGESASALRTSSTRWRFTPMSRWPSRDAERTWIALASGSYQNSTSSTNFIQRVVYWAYR